MARRKKSHEVAGCGIGIAQPTALALSGLVKTRSRGVAPSEVGPPRGRHSENCEASATVAIEFGPPEWNGRTGPNRKLWGREESASIRHEWRHR